MKKVFINHKSSIYEALELLSNLGEKSLIVLDSKRHFKGVLSDGDIRKAILTGSKLNSNISNIYNQKPFYIENDKNFSQKKIKSIFLKKRYDLVPVVDKSKKISKIIFWQDVFKQENQSVLKKEKNLDFNKILVVIMSGGRGKRLEPFSNVLPKPLIPINNKTIIEYIIDNFRKYKIENFFITLNYKKNIIKSYLKDTYNLNTKFLFLEEKKFEGTAGSLKYLKNHNIKKPFILTNCDIIVNSDYNEIYNWHIKKKNHLTIVTSLKKYQIPYGTCEMDKDGKLKKIIEKPTYNFLVNTGFYIISNNCLKYINSKGSFDMPQLIKKCLEKKLRVSIFPIAERDWIDIGQWAEYKKALNNIKDISL